MTQETPFIVTNDQNETFVPQDVTDEYIPQEKPRRSNLSPFEQVDRDPHDEPGTRVTIKFQKCPHELELVSSTHVRCTKCGAGWEGPNAYLLLQK